MDDQPMSTTDLDVTTVAALHQRISRLERENAELAGRLTRLECWLADSNNYHARLAEALADDIAAADESRRQTAERWSA